VDEGAFLDEAVNTCFSARKVPEAIKGLVYQIASGVVRQKIYLDWVLEKLIDREAKGDTRHLLLISLYQIAFMKKAHYHVVKEAVEFAKKQKGAKVANFVNAVLRRFVREREQMTYPEDPVCRLSISHSFPEWIVERWRNRFGGKETERLLTLLNEPPSFAVRINLERISKEDVIRELKAQGIKPSPGKLLDSALRVDKLGPVLVSRLFEEKLVSIQDETSQLVTSAAEPGKDDLVLDACAGLGTKTGQLMESSAGPVIVAMDNDIRRLRLIPKKANVVAGDALRVPFRKGLFDIIVADAPCSSLGIIRKHPEIKCRRKKEDVIRFGNYQLDLLKSLWDNLRQGGRMVYSVCSFEPEETVEVLTRFGKEREIILERPFSFGANEGYYLSLPQETGMDGFFIARFRKA
jgi:16S rRNA (cytosine967-C5)-methyltransferase